MQFASVYAPIKGTATRRGVQFPSSEPQTILIMSLSVTRYLYIAALAIFALGLLVFCLQNLETVSVSFLSWELNIPLALVAFGVYVLGMASGWGVLSFLRRSVRAVKKNDSAKSA